MPVVHFTVRRFLFQSNTPSLQVPQERRHGVVRPEASANPAGHSEKRRDGSTMAYKAFCLFQKEDAPEYMQELFLEHQLFTLIKLPKNVFLLQLIILV